VNWICTHAENYCFIFFNNNNLIPFYIQTIEVLKQSDQIQNLPQIHEKNFKDENSSKTCLELFFAQLFF